MELDLYECGDLLRSVLTIVQASWCEWYGRSRSKFLCVQSDDFAAFLDKDYGLIWPVMIKWQWLILLFAENASLLGPFALLSRAPSFIIRSSLTQCDICRLMTSQPFIWNISLPSRTFSVHNATTDVLTCTNADFTTKLIIFMTFRS